VIPADARTFRVADPALAATLLDAGGHLTDTSPDVEIVSPDDVSGDAAHVIAVIDAGQQEGGGRFLRAARRLLGSLRARLSAARARRVVRSHGYGTTSVVLWDVDQVVYIRRAWPASSRRPLAEHLPQRALVVGSHSPGAPSVLEAVAQEVQRHTGVALHYGLPLARVGLTLAISDGHVVRIAIGPGRRKIELQRAALERLAAAKPPSLLVNRVPWTQASGRVGLADWSVERRLPGTTASPALAPQLVRDCTDFLVALHGATGSDSMRAPVTQDAEIVAGVCGPEHHDGVIDLGRELDSRLAELPRGFGHGDFWTRNLLVIDDRLAGVIDWDAAGPDRLPVLDLLHLCLSARRERTREYLGAALVRYMLPWARSGGDETVRTYCSRIGIDIGGTVLEDLVLAYWLNRVAFELSLFADRIERPLWMENNVQLVLETLARDARVSA